jgi:NADH-quinone oxidoreductase subunit M
MVTAHLGPVMMWLAIGVLAGFAVKVPMFPFHTWLPAAYAEAPSPVTMLLTGAMSKMGVYGLLRIAMPMFGHADCADADAAAGAGGGDGGDGRMGRGGAEGFEAGVRVLVVNHLGYCLLGIFALAVPVAAGTRVGWQPGCGAERRDSADVQSRRHGGGAVLVCGDAAAAHGRASRDRRFWRAAQACAGAGGLMGIALFSSLGLPG